MKAKIIVKDLFKKKQWYSRSYVYIKKIILIRERQKGEVVSTLTRNYRAIVQC